MILRLIFKIAIGIVVLKSKNNILVNILKRNLCVILKKKMNYFDIKTNKKHKIDNAK